MGTGRVSTAGRLRSAVSRGPLGGTPGTARKPGTGLRAGTAGRINDGARPMTAVKAAGYVGPNCSPSPGVSRAGTTQGPSDAERCTKMQAEVHELIEAAATLMHARKAQEGTLLLSATPCAARMSMKQALT
jgi:hypothetical protein